MAAMSQKPAANVPTMLPTVESAYSEPTVAPESEIAWSFNRMQ
jgi:hypothetical protein